MIGTTILYSGSKGNATYINIDGYGLLLDAGGTFAKLTKAMALIGKDPAIDIQAVFVSHGHGDHISAIPKLCKANPSVMVYAEKTFWPTIPAEHFYKITPGLGVFAGRIGMATIDIMPFRLNHDEPCVGFSLEIGNYKIVYITDSSGVPCGSLIDVIDPTILIVECNHDLGTLGDCPYPDSRKERIAQTHMRAEQTADIIHLLKAGNPGLKHIVLFHLSANTINKELAVYGAKAAAQGCPVTVAEQNNISKTITLM